MDVSQLPFDNDFTWTFGPVYYAGYAPGWIDNRTLHVRGAAVAGSLGVNQCSYAPSTQDEVMSDLGAELQPFSDFPIT